MRRDGRAVECNGLENRQAVLSRLRGSNPRPSASERMYPRRDSNPRGVGANTCSAHARARGASEMSASDSERGESPSLAPASMSDAICAWFEQRDHTAKFEAPVENIFG